MPSNWKGAGNASDSEVSLMLECSLHWFLPES